MQRLGLEWLFRMAQEPRRLAPRYLKTNTAFAAILLKAILAGQLSAASRARPSLVSDQSAPN